MQENTRKYGGLKSRLPTQMLRKESHTSHVLKSGSENAKCHTLNGKPIQNIAPPNSGDDGANDWKSFIGKPVCISGVKEGILQYYGRTQFADGLWCGVELKEPVGKNDGTVNGVHYFTCLPNHGIFAPVTKVTVLSQLKSSGNTLTEDQNFYRRDEAKVELPEVCKNVCYLKQSSSDPTFQKTNIKCFCPNCRRDTSFGDKRCFTEQRELNVPLLDHETCKSTFEFLPFGKLKTSSTSPSSNLFEKRHSISNLRQFHYSNGKQELSKYGPKGTLEHVFKCTAENNTAPTCLESTSVIENTSKESLTGFSVAAKPERQLLRFEGQGLSLKHCIDAYQSESKYRIPSSDSLETKDDDDDQLSLDYDESLGILSPSQMKDFTLCGDLSTSCSEIARAVDFPSSESFDDVNDLPEDEIAHDVSIQFMASGPTSIVTSVTVSQSNIADSVKMQHMLRELKQNISPKPMLSCTEQFLLNVSSDSVSDVHFEPCPVDSVLNKNSILPENKTEVNDININVSQANSIPSDPESSTPEILDTSQSESSVRRESQNAWFNSYSQPLNQKVERFSNQEFFDYPYEEKFHYSHSQKPEKLFADHENDSEKHSHFSSSSEHLVSKEKVSVSWEEGTVHSPDKINSKGDRPESVYTVSSCDTGYQEEGEEEEDIDAVMTISTESAKENKKSSVTSRDSGVIMDDIDALKAVESASTSGYSTGLSDSYYNDRPEEEGSRPFMEDSFRDVHDSYHSDDGLIDPPMSVSMDESVGAMPEKTGGFFDMDSYKEGEVNTEFQITESSTILGLDTTCKSFVEDDTCFDRSANGSVTSQHNETVITKENSSSGNEAKAPETKKNSPIPDKPSQNSTESFQQSLSGRKDNDAQSPISSKVSKTQIPCENSVKSDDTKKQLLKSPKRKVMCRIKAAIENSTNRVSNKNKQEVNEQDNVKVVVTKKKSRWESVTSKIAASLAEEKTKSKPKKDVKSKVDTNLAAARQACRSPKLEQSSNTSEKSLDYSLSSPTSSRSRRTHPENYRDPDGRNINVARVDRSPQSPRPGKACLSSRSVSPVAASESSTTSHTASSHHSRSKIAVWKGSNNAVAPPLVSPQVKKPFMGTAFKLISRVNRIQNKDIAKEKQVTHTVPVESVVTNTGVKTARTPVAKLDTTPKPYCSKFKTAKEQQHGHEGRPIVPPKPIRPPMWLSKAELTQEIQHLSTLCESRTKELNKLKMQTKHVTRGFDALAITIKYMFEDLKAIENPCLVSNLKQTQEKVDKEKKDLECYEQKIAALNNLHAKEMSELLETLTQRHESELQELIMKHTAESNFLQEQHKREIISFTEALKASCEEERLQQEKLIEDLRKELKQQREEVEMFHQQELDDLEERHIEKEKALREEIKKLQKQLSDAKQSSCTMEEALQKDTDSKLHWLSEKKNDLQKEVESLKAVLEIKNNELHSLRKENLEMQKELEELPLAKEKIKMLQARAEDLQALMSDKVQLERQLSTEHKIMKENYEKEAKVSKRLSMENEELQWRLKQLSEQTLLSGSVGEMYEETPPEETQASDPPSEYDEELTPAFKTSSPISSSSKPMFFTYMNEEELALSSHSPRMHYKQIKPCSSSHKSSPVKPFKSSSTPSPRKSKGSTDSSPHFGGGTPRKVAKHISRAAQRSSAKQKAVSNNVEEKTRTGSSASEHLEVNLLGFADSMVSSASSDNSVFEPCLLEEHGEEIRETLKLLQEQKNTELLYGISSPSYDSKNKWHITSEVITNEGATMDQNDASESIDPKTFYHVAFPVLKESESAQDVESESVAKEGLSEHENK